MPKGKKYKYKGPEPNVVYSFDCACRFFPVAQGEDWSDAPVQCNYASICIDLCDKCGWNPKVCEARKAKLFAKSDEETHTV